MSDLFLIFSIYSLTNGNCSFEAIFLTSGCSGAKQQYVHPNNVSARVVNTLNESSLFLILKII